MFNVKPIIIVIWVGLISTQTQYAKGQNSCLTPDKKNGFCVVVRSCKSMVDFIQQSQTLPPSTIDLLRSYQCGFEGESAKVCCPQDGQIASENTDTLAAPDIGKHRNLNLLPADCGIFSPTNRIIGDLKTTLFEFPWMVLLSYQNESSRNFGCGGTIINNRYILTAASCLVNLSNRKLVSVRVGEHTISTTLDCETDPFVSEMFCAPPVQDIDIQEVIPHPNYNSITFTNDIGLIRLASPINTTLDNAQPICLPSVSSLRNYNLTDVFMYILGWGVSEKGQRSDALLQFDVVGINEENCRSAYKNFGVEINHKNICTRGRKPSDFCSGDIGGPLHKIDFINTDVRFVQHGIMSFGSPFCNQTGFTGVYTRTNYYMDWILNNIKV